MARKALPRPKICERCEAFFPSIGSDTCPQCFSPLTPLTEEEAGRAAQWQLERMKDPTYLEEKSEQDEKFKEQSFGACLAVVVIFIFMIILCVTFISVAKVHRHTVHRSDQVKPVRAMIASEDTVFPRQLGDLEKNQEGSVSQTLDGMSILHAKYGDNILVYALPITQASTRNLDAFRLAISAIDSQTSPPLVSEEVHGKTAYYAIIGANGGLVGDVAQRLINLQT